MCRNPKLLIDCTGGMHEDCPRFQWDLSGSGNTLYCECWCHSASVACPSCGWKQLAGFTQCVNCNARFGAPVKVPNSAPTESAEFILSRRQGE
jgi:hypothetical protein